MAGFDGAGKSKEQTKISFDAIRDQQWEVQFSRFICYPSSTATATSTSTILRPLQPYLRNRPPRGTWISSSSTAFLQLLHHGSTSDFILAVRLQDKLLVSPSFSTLLSMFLLAFCFNQYVYVRYENVCFR